jgi:hypothetical protein
MNCTECKEILVEYIEGLLDESQKQAVSEHLKSCLTCKAELHELTKLNERLVKNGKNAKNSNLENKVMDAIVREQNVRLKASDKAGLALKLRSIIMKSPMIKLAAAAVIIIVILVGLNPFGSAITFGQVIAPILNAGTIAYDFISGSQNNSPLMHDIFVGSKIRREMPNLAMTMIIDLDAQKMLLLSEADKTAAYVDIQGPLQEMTQSYVKFLRKVVLDNKDNYKELGEIVIDGRKTIAFEAGNQNESVLIYADPKTALPIRIDLTLGKTLTILDDFQFDFPVDESLVSMEVPVGYNFKQEELDMTSASEQDFIESLRIWAEILNDGAFPEAIGSENAVKQVALLGQKLGQMNLTEQEATQIGLNFGKGMLFHQILETQNKGQYVGAGVELGDSDSPIFLYQPEGSVTYRVIYGDLHVEDVAPDNLPQ